MPFCVVYLYLIDPLKLPLLADAAVGEDVTEDGAAGDLAARAFAEHTDGKEKGDKKYCAS